METMGSYFARLAEQGKLNEVDNNELQGIMQRQAENMGFTGVSVRVLSKEEVQDCIEESEKLSN